MSKKPIAVISRKIRNNSVQIKKLASLQAISLLMFSMISVMLLPTKVKADGFVYPTISAGGSVSGYTGHQIDITGLSVSYTGSETLIPVDITVSSGTLSIDETGLSLQMIVTSATRIAFRGTLADVNTALSRLKYTSASPVNTTINVTLNVDNYDAANQRMYRYDTATKSWDAAQTSASDPTKTYFGHTGYLAKIDSSSENDFINSVAIHAVWIGAKELTSEGNWNWAVGPGSPVQFWNGGPAGTGGTPVTGLYNNWNINEPADSGNLGCGLMTPSGDWDDYICTEPLESVVEFGSDADPIPTPSSTSVSVSVTDDTSVVNVTSCADLINIASNSSEFIHNNIVINNNINCGGATIQPLFLDYDYLGTLDGQNHTISNFVINQPWYASLVGRTGASSVIKNLKIDEDVTIQGDYHVASFVSYGYNSNLQNLTSSANIIVRGTSTWGNGGIAGHLENDSNYIASLTGNDFSGALDFSEASDGVYSSGGVFGEVDVYGGATINVSGNSSSASINQSGGYTGGLIGYFYGDTSESLNIKDNLSNANIISGGGDSSTAGLIGYVDLSNSQVNIEDNSVGASISLTGFNSSGGGVLGTLSAYQSNMALSNNTFSGILSAPNFDGVGGILGSFELTAGTCNIINNIVANVDGNPILGHSFVAGLIGIGSASDSATINLTQNIVDRSVTAGNLYAAGLVGSIGMSNSTTNFNLNSVSSTVSAPGGYSGGLIAKADNSGSNLNVYQNIVEKTDSGMINGSNSTGGLIGIVLTSGASTINSISQNIVNQDVNSDGFEVGGLLGSYYAQTESETHTANINDNYTTGAVIGQEYSGGLVGALYTNQSYVGEINFKRNYATGNVTSNITGDPAIAGGLFGYSSNVGSGSGEMVLNIDNSFATGLVTGDYTGGIMGQNSGVGADDSPISVGLYYDQSTTGQSVCNPEGEFQLANCTAVNTDGTQPDYFKNNTVNAPLNTWNFSTVWGSASLNNGYPCLQWSNPLCNPAGDVDGDGITNQVENASPNNGDANSDGILDYLQPQVTTLIDTVSSKYVVVQTTCNENSEVSNSAESGSYKDPNFTYPSGLTSFTTTCSAAGATAKISYYIYGSYDPTGVTTRKYNPSTHAYTTVADAQIGNTTVGGQQALLVQYFVTDGGEYDLDGVANGVIVDPVGIGVASVNAPNTGYGRI